MPKPASFLSLFLILTVLGWLFSGCSGTINLVEKDRLGATKIKFYFEKKTYPKPLKKTLYAEVSEGGHMSYYSFNEDGITKIIDRNKELLFIAIDGDIPADTDPLAYSRFTAIDSFVLKKAARQIEALRLNTFQRLEGLTGFRIEVNWLHGYPKGRKFRPW